MPMTSDSMLIESRMSPDLFLLDTSFTMLIMLKIPEVRMKIIMLTKAMKPLLLEGIRS